MVGDELLAARSRCGISQRELARRVHTSQAAISRYERGMMEPAVGTWRRLLAACQTPEGQRVTGSTRRLLARFPASAEEWDRRPYFMWSEDISWRELARELRDDDGERRRLIAHILDHARWADIWRLLEPSDVASVIDDLPVRHAQTWREFLARTAPAA